jgi:hypothetical protein
MAAAYVQCGWKVIALHDVTAGCCSCRDGQYCGSPGKHPVGERWQVDHIGDVPSVYAAWAARPSANVGIVTGPASGVWVLDVDPVHGGNEGLALLVETVLGVLPDTFTVSTGSGGTHYYWSLSNVTFDLTNRRGQLPPGIDVRGRGGFVVAPPSVSGRGPYRILTDPDHSVLRYL